MRPNKSLQPARAKPARRLSLGVTLLEDHSQKRLLPTTFGGGASDPSTGSGQAQWRAGQPLQHEKASSHADPASSRAAKSSDPPRRGEWPFTDALLTFGG